MLLMVDVGNTAITVACYHGAIRRIGQLKTCPFRSSDEYGLLFHGLLSKKGVVKPDSAVIASVVPPVTGTLLKALKERFRIEPLNLSYTKKTGLTFSVKKPEQIGVDRIVNAAAAHKFYKGALVIIDSGTATTFCAITKDGQYLGGPIMPGPAIMAEALADKTAALPPIELDFPESIIGSNTVENIISGIAFGHAGAIEKIAYEMKRTLSQPVTVIGTGGFIHFAEPLVSCFDEIDKDLTMKGLHLLYEMNRPL